MILTPTRHAIEVTRSRHKEHQEVLINRDLTRPLSL
jgi:hypothetical protein